MVGFGDVLELKFVCRLNEKSLNFGVGGLSRVTESFESFGSFDLERALSFCIFVFRDVQQSVAEGTRAGGGRGKGRLRFNSKM